MFWKFIATAYFALLSWQLLSPVTVISAGGYDKLFHFMGFFILAVLSFQAWQKNLALTQLGIVLIAYGLLTECLQYFIVGRSFSLFDALADGLGVMGAFVLFHFLPDKSK